MAPEAGGAPDAVYIGSSPGEDPLAPDVKIQSRRSGATNRWGGLFVLRFRSATTTPAVHP